MSYGMDFGKSLDARFFDFNEFEDSDTEEDNLDEEDCIVGEVLGVEEERGGVEMNLGISEAEAMANYMAAGTEVQEEEDDITVAGNSA